MTVAHRLQRWFRLPWLSLGLASTLQILPAFLASGAETTAPAVPPALSPASGSEAKSDPAAEAAWKEIEDQRHLNGLPPSGAARTNMTLFGEWRAKRGTDSIKLADMLRGFQDHFPSSPRLLTSKQFELDALRLAVINKATNALERLIAAEEKFLPDPTATPEDRFRIKQERLDRSLEGMSTTNRPAYVRILHEETRKLMQEFPSRRDFLQLNLLTAADLIPSLEGVEIAKEISNSSTGRVKQASERFIARVGWIGKPVSLNATNIDGGEISLEKLKGKVVLLEFGASWSAPWQRDLPQIEEAYKAFHDQGLEVVGISFDSDRIRLKEFLRKKSIPWPYYCDAEGYRSRLIQELKVSSVPTRWLIDRKGIVREVNARDELKERIAKLLAESP